MTRRNDLSSVPKRATEVSFVNSHDSCSDTSIDTIIKDSSTEDEPILYMTLASVSNASASKTQKKQPLRKTRRAKKTMGKTLSCNICKLSFSSFSETGIYKHVLNCSSASSPSVARVIKSKRRQTRKTLIHRPMRHAESSKLKNQQGSTFYNDCSPPKSKLDHKQINGVSSDVLTDKHDAAAPVLNRKKDREPSKKKSSSKDIELDSVQSVFSDTNQSLNTTSASLDSTASSFMTINADQNNKRNSRRRKSHTEELKCTVCGKNYSLIDMDEVEKKQSFFRHVLRCSKNTVSFSTPESMQCPRRNSSENNGNAKVKEENSGEKNLSFSHACSLIHKMDEKEKKLSVKDNLLSFPASPMLLSDDAFCSENVHSKSRSGTKNRTTSRKCKGPENIASKNQEGRNKRSANHSVTRECPICCKVFHVMNTSVAEINQHVIYCSNSQQRAALQDTSADPSSGNSPSSPKSVPNSKSGISSSFKQSECAMGSNMLSRDGSGKESKMPSSSFAKKKRKKKSPAVKALFREGLSSIQIQQARVESLRSLDKEATKNALKRIVMHNLMKP